MITGICHIPRGFFLYVSSLSVARIARYYRPRKENVSFITEEGVLFVIYQKKGNCPLTKRI